MFKKPAPPGKENVVAPRPRLGLSSLQHSAKMKVENDIESAGASLKVLSVENSRKKVTPSTIAVNKPKAGTMNGISSQPTHSTVRSAQETKSAMNNAGTKVNGARTEPATTTNSKSGVLRKDPGGSKSSADKVNVTNVVESKSQTSNTDEHEQKAAVGAENGDSKKADLVEAPQNGDKPTTIKKMGSWELSNFDIGRPLGRGKIEIYNIVIIFLCIHDILTLTMALSYR